MYRFLLSSLRKPSPVFQVLSKPGTFAPGAVWSRTFLVGHASQPQTTAHNFLTSTRIKDITFSPRLRNSFNFFLDGNKPHVKELAEKWAQFESRVITVVSSVSLSTSGQKTFSTLVSPFLAAFLYPHGWTCHALDASPLPSPPPPSSLWTVIYNSILNELILFLRSLYLISLFFPAIATSPLSSLSKDIRLQWLELVNWTLQRAGPAFIKWGQWAATRPDLFPQDLCATLEKLQTAAPTHSAEYSRRTIAAAFGRGIDELFEEFDDEPVASGSIAQIHRAVLSKAGAKGTKYCAGTVVAVKVRHPFVTTLMDRDFKLMMRTAEMLSKIPMLSEMRLEESVQQFGGPLREQLNLKAEARNLQRFNHNFRFWSSVSFPYPIFPLVEADVLVETFEEGNLISRYVKQPGYKFNEKIAETGMQLYLQMLLKDNFIHADMHPGNILVKEVDAGSVWGKVVGFLGVEPKLILLDTGMIAELTKTEQKGVISLFKALTVQDGEQIASAILSVAELDNCKDESAFISDMKDYFDALDPSRLSHYTSDVLREVIETVRQHHVTLKGCISTVVVTTLVLEGWSSKLDPDIQILETVKEILSVDWSDRICRSVDKIMASGSVAIH